MLENNPLITMAVVLREVVLQEALNKPTEQCIVLIHNYPKRNRMHMSG